MRLTCPNCGAQYEVPDEVIPENGRDVQCSNCGDTWFQHHADHAPDPADEPSEEPSWDAPGEEEPHEQAPIEAEPDQAEDTNTDTEDGDHGDDADEPSDDPDDDMSQDDPDPDTPARRELDPAVSDLLREEAERETAARAAEGGHGLETQPDLGLSEGDDDTDKRTRESQTRMARLRGDPDPDEDDGPDPGTRRNLLPDIDEINSSLSSDSTDPGMVHTSDSAEAMSTPKSGGFRRGFLSMVILAIIGLLIYMFAPQLAAAVPALDGALASYVEMINGLRGWLDQTIGGLMGTLDGMSSEGS